MAVVEAVLIYRARGLGQEGHILLGATEQPLILQAVGAQLRSEAWEVVEIWKDIDQGLSEIKHAEAERLERVLATILPPIDAPPVLGLVK